MPRRLARLPGPVLFLHHLYDRALQIDQILARDLNIRITEALNRSRSADHSGVVQDEHADVRSANALIVAHRRAPDVGQLGAH